MPAPNPRTLGVAGEQLASTHGWVFSGSWAKGGQRRLLQNSMLAQKISRIIFGWPFWCHVWCQWKYMKRKLQPQQYRFLPYCSLRRGSATWYFKMTGSFDQTMLRGRWQHQTKFQKPKWLWPRSPFHWPSNIAHGPATTLSGQSGAAGRAPSFMKVWLLSNMMSWCLVEPKVWCVFKAGGASFSAESFTQAWWICRGAKKKNRRCASCENVFFLYAQRPPPPIYLFDAWHVGHPFDQTLCFNSKLVLLDLFWLERFSLLKAFSL